MRLIPERSTVIGTALALVAVATFVYFQERPHDLIIDERRMLLFGPIIPMTIHAGYVFGTLMTRASMERDVGIRRATVLVFICAFVGGIAAGLVVGLILSMRDLD